MRRRILAVVVMVAAILVASSAIAYATHSWGGYHWARTTNPFTLKLANNVSQTNPNDPVTNWDSYLATTSADWSKSAVLDTKVVPSGKDPRKCRPTVGQDEVCNTAYGNNGWLGIAQIWLSGSHITQGTTKLNDSYFKTSTYNTPAWRNLVMCQEVGHTFGLDHQDENFTNPNLGTCMDYTNSPSGGSTYGLDNQHPNQHDYDELGIIYAHLDSTTTVGQNTASKTPAASDEGDNLNTPNGWGQLKKKSADGRYEVWERDLGNGVHKEKEKLVTFVIRPLDKDKEKNTKKNSRVANNPA